MLLGGSAGLFVVRLDGTSNRQLVPWKLGGGDRPVFSPDGWIIFRRREEDEKMQTCFWTVRAFRLRAGRG